MSGKVLQQHTVCIVADAGEKLTGKLTKKFSALSVECILLTPALLETKTFKEINQIFQQSNYLILLLNSENLESDSISFVIKRFMELRDDKSIIPLFTGSDFSDPKVCESPIIQNFGNRIIESAHFSSSELLKAICLRIQAFSEFMDKAEKNETKDVPSISDNIFTIRNSSLQLMQGNILDSKCEVIVSSDDNLLTHGGGVSYAIFEAGGVMLETDAKKQIPAALGDVVVTTAGILVQKMIFHAITIALVKGEKQKDSLPPNEQIDIQEYIVSNVIRRCFLLLSSLRLSSIAFPVIGSGTAQIPFQKAIFCMLKTFAELISKTAQPWRVELWIYNDHGLDISSIARTILTAKDKSESALLPMPPGKPTKHDIFISYSRQDTLKIQKILAFMNEKGFSYWIDVNGFYSGESYKEVIVQSIRQSKMVLFFSSENSNQSENVIKEISCAVNNKKPVIPVKIDSSRYSDAIEYDLSFIDYIDMVNDKEPFKKLLCSITSRL